MRKPGSIKTLRLTRTLRLTSVVALLMALGACGGSTDSSGQAGGATPSAKFAVSTTVVNAPVARVTGVTKINETRVSRTEYDYVFRVNLQNGPAAQPTLTANLTAAGAGVSIISSVASFGSMAANATATSTNTITLRVDRTLPFNPNALVWSVVTETPVQAISRLETAHMIPVLDRTTSLAGPDSNHNGIRDDIEAFLDSQNLPQPRRLAAEQLARAMQEAVVINSADPALTFPIADRMTKAVACVWDRFPTVASVSPLSADQMVKAIQKLTANTRARVTSYMVYNGSLNGSVSTSPSGDTCAN